jgi:hypothetical protein
MIVATSVLGGTMSKKPTHKFTELLQYPEMNGVMIQSVFATLMNKQACNYLCSELMKYIRENAQHGFNYRFGFVQDGKLAATDDILLKSFMYTDAGIATFSGTLVRFHKPAPGQAVRFCMEASKGRIVSCF